MNAREITDLAIGVYGAMQKNVEFQQLIELILTKPHETILEIGSGRGGTLWAWSHLPGNRTVISVDLPGGDFGGGLTPDDRERIENWIDKSKNTFLCAMDSHFKETRKEVIDTLNEVGDGFVDILMIDGGHLYEDVKLDFEMYTLLVRRGGLVILHDIEDHSTIAPTCQVKKFWDEIKDNYEYKEFLSEPHTWGGLGVIQW